MLTEKKIYSELKKIKIKEKYIIIHSDISGLYFKNFNIKKLWEIVFNSFGAHKTYILPTFTFSFHKKKKWNCLTSKSETGALSEYFRTSVANFRTIHPIHSVAVLGKSLNRFKKFTCASSFGKKSVWEFLSNSKDVCNISIGTGFVGGATFCHHVEEKNLVPYRKMVNLYGKIISNDKKIIKRKFNYFARDKNNPLKNDWNKCYNELLKKKLIKVFKFKTNGIQILKMNTFRVSEYLDKRVNEDPYFLIKKNKSI